MTRTLLALCLSAALTVLAGCRNNGAAVTAAVTQAAISAANAPADPNDTRIARQVFGHISTPSTGAALPFGSYARGCSAGAVALAETGPTWQAMRLSRNRYWGQPVLVDYIEDLSSFAATQPGWSGLYVGDMSQARGGPMLTGHASHQIGLDVDIWTLPATRLDLTPDQRESLSSNNLARSGGAYTNANFTPAHMAILRAAAQDPRVARIFLFPGGKVWMCEHETGDRAWLNKIRPWYGHQDHFHVRLSCPPGAVGCTDQAPPPAGDGCDDARQWVADILNPPPPDPSPTPGRGPLLIADLPGACGALAAE